ncbi:class A beta-lactamase [Thalassospira sp. MA62]|nr:class A beta-lactamase [Thalassospira sp. MA62]
MPARSGPARAVLACCAVLSLCGVSLSATAQNANDPIGATVQSLEDRLDARIGLAVIDTQTGRTWNHRSKERFPMTSTFKALACAAILQRVDHGQEDLSRRVVFTKDDLVAYSPVTEKHVGKPGMTIGALCDATMSLSDNTAGNLVLDALGGPDAVTAFLRDIGDDVSRLDRWEPDLNEATPGDARDTTTPADMAADLQKLVLGDVLSDTSRTRLTDWLVGNEVGGPLIRAGMPKSWVIGDRTGAGGYGSRANVGVVWPAGQNPVVVAIYITQTDADFETRSNAIAEIGHAIAKAIAPDIEPAVINK